MLVLDVGEEERHAGAVAVGARDRPGLPVVRRLSEAAGRALRVLEADQEHVRGRPVGDSSHSS
jgi:hypothetical protein